MTTLRIVAIREGKGYFQMLSIATDKDTRESGREL